MQGLTQSRELTLVISKTEAYLKEEGKESLENRKTDNVREEGKI